MSTDCKRFLPTYMNYLLKKICVYDGLLFILFACRDCVWYQRTDHYVKFRVFRVITDGFFRKTSYCQITQNTLSIASIVFSMAFGPRAC